MAVVQPLYLDLTSHRVIPSATTDRVQLGGLGIGGSPPTAGLVVVGELTQSGGVVSLVSSGALSLDGTSVDVYAGGGAHLSVSGGVIAVGPGILLEASGGMVNLPPLFGIDSAAVSANVTAANLNILTGGGATTLHAHADVPTTRTISTTAPLTGGGDLSANRTFAISDFVASGASHARGAVPDPGSSAGTTKYLREDATWVAPTASVGYPLSIAAGTMTDGVPIATLTGTLPTSPASAALGMYLQVTTAGSAGPNPTGMLFRLETGYTGGSTTYGFRGVNAVAGQGNTNIGFEGGSGANGLYACFLGVFGYATQTGGTSTVNGGYFALTNGPSALPSIGSAALVADNASISAPILVCADNGTPKLTVADGGHLTFADAVNVVAGTSTGTKIGTGTTQLLGFWNAAPVAQQSDVAAPTGGVVVDIEARAWCASVRTLLRTIGLMA